jgi:signal transduction histidine kinase
MVRRAGWRGDAACVAGALAFAVLLLSFGDASASSTPPWPVDAAIGVTASLALWWRRRWPLGLAVALGLLGVVSASTTAPMSLALFTLAAYRPARVALPVAGASLAGVAGYFALQHDPAFPIWVDFVVRGVIIAAAVGWGMFAGAQRQLVQSLRERAARLEAEQHLRIEQARLTERTRIAREMHDVLAHRLSLVSLHAGALELRTDARPGEVATAAGVIRTNAHAALDDLRAVIGVLRENGAGRTPRGAERPQPDLRDVAELVESARAAGTVVRYDCTIDETDLPTGTGRTVYRIVQEALTNARKHAPGVTVEVLVDGSPAAGVRVCATNPVPVTAPAGKPPGAGLGLVGLSERIALAGGRLAHTGDAAAFTVEAWLPWPT